MAVENEYQLGKTTLDYKVLLNNEDPEKGEELVSTNIKKISLSSSMFNLLPTLNLIYNDDGSYFNTKRFKIGQLIYITILPKQIGQDEERKVYVKSRYRIQSINAAPANNGENVIYDLFCIYDAVNTFAKISEYPENQLIAVQSEENSNEAIFGAMSDASVSMICDVEGKDKMTWVNSKLNKKEFIEKIALHAWIDDDDAPVLYTNLNGECHYTSLDTLCKDDVVGNYVTLKNFQEQENKDNYMIYNTAVVTNPGGIMSNDGGMTRQVHMLDTNGELLDSDENMLISDGPSNLTELANAVFGDIAWSNYPIQYTYKTPVGKLGTTVSRDDALSDEEINVKDDCGLVFPGLHQHYDVAPAHNIALLKSFFQVFVTMTVNLSNQTDVTFEKERLPKIGQKIMIDFKHEDAVNKIYTGNYIICGVNLTFEPSKILTAKLTCVSDGVYGDG